MRRFSLVVGLSVLAFCTVDAGEIQEQLATAAAEPAEAPSLGRFVGLWDYNEQESVNAANGRPEQAPVSATQRGVPAARGGNGGRGGGGGRGQQQRGARGVLGEAIANRNRGLTVGPTAMDLAERRDLERDLLEVPEALHIEVEADAVSFTDDLGRTLIYPTTGQSTDYQLSASRFRARTVWDGIQLRKEIEGAAGFRMTEVYFLSETGDRLFVIVRLGEPDPDPEAPPVGFNRVYDRVESRPES